MKRNLTPIASGVALFLMGVAMSAQAQEQAAQTVTVTGIRASLAASINQKRNSDTHVEVITAEDVGKMPDKNVADSLQHLPGVNVAAAGGGEGSFGENDRVALRGTPFNLTLTTANGHTVSSGDWFADNIINGGRSVSFTLFPSELIGKVTVNKGARADLLEGGAMGVVDIATRKPLDFKKSLTAQGSLGVEYSENAKKTDPQIAGLVSWKNDDSTLGVLVQAFYKKRHISRAGQENQIWQEKTDPGSPLALANPASVNAYSEYLGGTAWFEQQRTTKGGFVDFQIKPSRDFNADLTLFDSKMDAPNINHNYMQSLGRMLGPGWAGNGAYPTSAISATVNNNVVTSLSAGAPAGCTQCANMSSGVQEEFDRPVAYSQSQFVNLDANFRASDNLNLAFKLGSTRGIGDTQSGALGVWTAWGTGGSYQMNGSQKAVTYVTPNATTFSIGGFNNGAPGQPGAPYTYGSSVRSTDKETYGQFDGTLKLDTAGISALKFGLRFANHERNLSVIGINATPDLSNAANLPMSGLTSFPSIFNNIDANGAGYWTFSQDAVNSWLSKYAYYSGELKQSEFTIKEPTTAAYVMADFGGEGFSGNYGARLVHTTEQVDHYTSGAGGLVPETISNTYNDILPSANFKLDFAKDLIGRFSVSRTMARPELGALSGLDLRDIQLFGNVGNPQLRPTYGNNTDFNLEWYFSPKSMVSAGVFYSQLDGYVTYGSGSGTYFNQLQKQNTVYQTSQPLNTSAEVKGLELYWLQDLGNGFGINTNYTYTDGQETGKAPGSVCAQYNDCRMIGTSKDAFNVGGFFENDQFNARLTYSWRSKFLNGLSRNSAAQQQDIGTLSATLGYKISDNLTISVDGKDLNDPLVHSITTKPGTQDMPASLYKNGRQIFVTLQAKM